MVGLARVVVGAAATGALADGALADDLQSAQNTLSGFLKNLERNVPDAVKNVKNTVKESVNRFETPKLPAKSDVNNYNINDSIILNGNKNQIASFFQRVGRKTQDKLPSMSLPSMTLPSELPTLGQAKSTAESTAADVSQKTTSILKDMPSLHHISHMAKFSLGFKPEPFKLINLLEGDAHPQLREGADKNVPIVFMHGMGDAGSRRIIS
jgi:hypothetical protein